MNSRTINKACERTYQLLCELPEIYQQEVMLQAAWDFEHAGMPEPLRTDNPKAFCMDMKQMLNNQNDQGDTPMLMDEFILECTDPAELLNCLVP